MTMFWFGAALFIAGALLFLLPPLWAPASATATPSALPPARRTAIVLALVLPASAVGLYMLLGQPAAVATQAAPSTAQGWMALARQYVAVSRFGDAALALRRVVEQVPPNASLLADLADVTSMAQGKRLAGEPARLVQQALDLDPRHVKALSLAGSVAFEARDYAAARGYWQRALDVLPAGSPLARSLQGSVLEATQLEGAQAGAAPAAQPAAAAALSGEVAISPALAARVPPGATLFVFARAAQGPRMPLAIVRRAVGPWPAAFKLDDSQAMAPELRLSGFAQVVVGARVSASGSATPQSGDLVGSSTAVAPGTTGLRVLIDGVQP